MVNDLDIEDIFTRDVLLKILSFSQNEKNFEVFDKPYII